MLGDKVSAQEALNMGMLYKIFSNDTLIEEALKITFTLSNLPTKALGLTKRLLNEGVSNNLETQLKEKQKNKLFLQILTITKKE